MDRTPPLIIVTGPTGAGKTALALALARDFPLEVVSADSMQVYRHMDIATAKPSREEQAVLPHTLIDIREPDEEFNAGMFMDLASRAISEIRSRGRIPLVVGGTGLYIKALLYGLAPAPPRSPELRAWLRARAGEKGSDALWETLRRYDPENAEKTGRNDVGRIVRSLEIAFLTGLRPSGVLRGHGFSTPRFDARVVCVMPERDSLYRAIDARVEGMFEAGLVEETRHLLDLGFDPGLRSMQTLAYKHVVGLLEGALNFESALGRIRRDTRHYAKRQVTWMRSHHERKVFQAPGRALETLSGWLEDLLAFR